jgi:hemolysin activation/secretion protein
MVRPLPTAAPSYEWRVFAEWQRPAAKETDLSIPHLVRQRHSFRDNITAARARDVGTSLVLRGSRGVSTHGVTVAAELVLDAHLGTFEFARAGLTTRLTAPLSGRLIGALELAAGTTGGAAPVQRLWYLGGPATLRGYPGGAIAGPDYWRGRVELGNAFPGARLALFGDAGWAGRGTEIRTGRPRAAAGIGASFLDGLVRIDLARALVTPRGWRMDFYVDGIL